ncbi:MAG TPA: NAD-dependent epimerase/dehydratase family protein [Hyphomicrobiales bacterium]|nr:NAD-dependent epimerase/dehydratase family protein [Hyphomicrobiales bacterium]
MRTVLVTGAGGFLGQALLAQLLEDPELRIQACLRGRNLPPELCRHPRLVLYQGDLKDADFCDELCSGVDLIIHLAGRAHTGGGIELQWAQSYTPTQMLGEAALRQGVAKLIFVSSIKAADPGQSAYAEIKYRQEEWLLDLHQRGQLKVVCLRPALIYGAGMRGNLATLLRLLRRPRLRLLPRPSGVMGMIGLQDCCRAIIAALDVEALEGGVWQLDDGTAYPIASLFTQVRRQLGLPAPWMWIPRPLLWLAAQLGELSAPFTHVSLGRGTYRTLYLERFTADSRFGALTGFEPTQTLQRELPVLLESLNVGLNKSLDK